MLKKQGVSKSGDVYQIGVVLYEMMVGIPPFYNDNMKVLYENIEKGKLTLPKYLSKEARKVVQKMLHKDPKKRPTLEQLMADPFFDEIDWKQLEERKLEPPLVLRKEGKANSVKENKKPDNNQEMLFASDSEDEDSPQRGGGLAILEDDDYTMANRNFQRVRNYSFSRGKWKYACFCKNCQGVDYKNNIIFPN